MSFAQHNPYGRSATVQIVNLTMHETGSYSRMFQRPYETNRINGHIVDDISRRINESGSTDISGALISGLAGQFLTPSAQHQGELHIPNGWDTRRLHWFMEVHITTNTGSKQVMYLQGYTSHVGISTGLVPGQYHIDPNMIFYINSYIVTNKMSAYGPTGYYETDVIVETAHVLNGQLIRSSHGADNAIAMRPRDVFTGMQSHALSSNMSYFNDMGGLNDTRIMFGNESIRSNRNNALPSNYVAKVVNGWKQSVAMAQFGQDQSDLCGRAMELVYESPVAENLFIRTISNIVGIPGITQFREPDLKMIQPDFPINIGLHTEVARMNTNYNGRGADWNSVNHLVVPATIIANAVPALMMENYLTMVHLSATNHTVNGQFHVDIFDHMSPTRADISQFINTFINRLKMEVLHDITFGNQESLVLDLKMSVFGESFISIAIGNNVKEDYFVPSFCDSLMAPVMTLNKNTFDGVVHDLNTLLNSIDTTNVAASPSMAVNFNV